MANRHGQPGLPMLAACRPAQASVPRSDTEEEHVSRSLSVGPPSVHPHRTTPEPASAEPVEEGRARRDRPDDDDAAGGERPGQALDALLAVEPVVGPERESGRAVVDVEQDRVPAAAVDACPDVPNHQRHAGIVEGAARELGERSPIELDDRGEQLGHVDVGLGPHRVEGGAQGEPHAEPSDQDAGREDVGELPTSEARHRFLGAPHPTRHEDVPADPDDVVPVLVR